MPQGIVLTIAEVTKEFKNIYGENFIVVPEFKYNFRGEKIIEIQCTEHDPPHVWHPTPCDILSKRKSLICHRSRNKTIYPQTIEELKKLSDEIHEGKGYIILDIYRDSDNRLKYKIYCPKHDHTWIVKPNHYLYKKHGCCKCANEKNQKYPQTIDELQKLSDEIHEGKGYIIQEIFIDKFISKSNKLQYVWKSKIWCPIHNKYWIASVQKYIGNAKTGCPICKSSKGENTVNQLLTKHNIKFDTQKTYPDLLGTNGGKLKIDFYLPDYNLCIEFNGRQHYENVSF